jgi:integrase
MAKRPIKKITKADVARLLDAYAQKPAARRKLYSYLSHFLGWCMDRDLVEVNVCRLIKPPKAVKARERVLNDAEIREVMNLKDSVWGTMLQIVLHTGLRGGEVCKMRIEELDLVKKTWRVPGSTMKQGHLHPAPLAESTVALIRGQIERNGEGWGPFVFGVGSNGAKPYNGRSNGLVSVHRLTDTSGWIGHDCRHTAITLMQTLGIPREVRQRVTGHAGPRDGASTYEHYDFEREAYAAVEKLAAELERLRQASDVSEGG